MTIYKSTFPDVPLSEATITQRVFENIDPKMTVLIDGPTGRKCTGAQFIQDVKSLAGGLEARGWGAGKTIALMAPNIPEFCALFHASAWAGGTVTTINPTYTAPEVNHQLEDAGAEVLITIAMFADIAKEAIKGTRINDIVIIDEAPAGMIPLDDLRGPPMDAQTPVDVASHVVVLPYSSGTTGLPKGVMLTHQNLVVNVDQILAVTGLAGARETTVAFLPFFHIYGLQVLQNVYMAAGGCLVTMPRFDLELFLSLIEAHKTPKLWIVPPVALALAKHPMVDKYDLSCLEQVNSAAAPLGADVAEAISQRLGTHATQAYGMTELSPASHVSPFGKGKLGASGAALPNTECRIVDTQTLKDTAPGQEGELWVRGPQVMAGYLNNPEATRESIVENGWLRTGDIARIDGDSFVYITDRLKELIKYKGFQVAPAELEAALVSHPDILDAAVIGVPDDESGEVPAAFIVIAQHREALSLEDVQSYLSQRLAPYKQVHLLNVVEAIPKSASGKILRRVLRDPPTT
ncbi:4-coumarate--CoA ligase family protein [Roseobacter denitrificans]|uniref:4-coumarate n=1 Tax=Roseobacter denitrificans (strain ATCC 33942 / OCh 114) TaxID=375451 RepID=Q168W4_ROSDO|nr:AMP-binding protein [Roseobacter denitrificans]ABG31479.1 4-coumarate [Roseobacter denitrificans OCh 114]AVL55072.1 4-coumarate--CoA ligase family protein [Roseobacter denitrificans]SFF90892.1 4-coumarate--CoA ligase [Roseobacter denitrificans OCh 114]